MSGELLCRRSNFKDGHHEEGKAEDQYCRREAMEPVRHSEQKDEQADATQVGSPVNGCGPERPAPNALPGFRRQVCQEQFHSEGFRRIK
jgi:hypothetical protein